MAKRRQRRMFTAAESAEVWDRWQGGEGLKLIGRMIGRRHTAVFEHLRPHGGIRPVPRRRSRRVLSLDDREELRTACQLYKFLYIILMNGANDERKDIQFVGTALDDLRAFPNDARRDAGYQLDKVQHGEDPDDWKPFPAVGPGTREIRITDDGDAFRVMYVAKFGDKIHVLHCFQKKKQATPKKDIDLAKKRYASLKKEFGT